MSNKPEDAPKIEAPHEKHNRIAVETVKTLVIEFPDVPARLTVLESIIAGIVGSLNYKEGKTTEGVNHVMKRLKENAKARIVKTLNEGSLQ